MVHDIIVYQVMRIKNGQCHEGTLCESTLYEGTLYELKGNKGGGLRPPPQKGGAPPSAARPLFAESFTSS